MALDMGRRARRDRPCAVLRLGTREPRRVDADARASGARRRSGGGAARAASRPHRDRCGGAGLPRALPKALRRRLGAALPERDAGRPGAAMPRRRGDSRVSNSGRCKDHSLRRSGNHSPAFNAFRGTGYLPEPAGSCERRETRFRGLSLPGVRPRRRCARRPIRCAISRRITAGWRNWPPSTRTGPIFISANVTRNWQLQKRPEIWTLTFEEARRWHPADPDADAAAQGLPNLGRSTIDAIHIRGGAYCFAGTFAAACLRSWGRRARNSPPRQRPPRRRLRHLPPAPALPAGSPLIGRPDTEAAMKLAPVIPPLRWRPRPTSSR